MCVRRIYLASVSTINQLDFGTVLMVRYFFGFSLFVLLAIVLSVLRIKDSDDHFDIFYLFL
jgi:hypothetical protein